MDDSIMINIENYEFAFSTEQFNRLVECTANFAKVAKQMLEGVRLVIRPLLKTIRYFLDMIIRVIYSYSPIFSSSYCSNTNTATIDISNIREKKRQSPQKIIGEEEIPSLSLSYSVFYNSDYILSNKVGNSDQSNCSKNSVINKWKTFKQKVRSSLNHEFFIQSTISVVLDSLISWRLPIFTIFLIMSCLTSWFDEKE